MDFSQSDLLDLRVFAISFRLKEVSTEVSEARGEAYELRQKIEEQTVASLFEKEIPTEDIPDLKSSLAEREAQAEKGEEEEMRLKRVLLEARREHLRQLKKDKPRRWMILE